MSPSKLSEARTLKAQRKQSKEAHLVEGYPQEALRVLHLSHNLDQAVGHQVDHLPHKGVV